MLKQRILSSCVIVAILAVVALANGPWFLFFTIVLTALCLEEIRRACIKKCQSLYQALLYAIVPGLYAAVTLLWIVNNLRWESSGYWILLAVGGTMAYDTLAFCAGKTLGRHKIMPRISPKKTWEGTIGGFFGSVPVAVIFGGYYLSLSLGQGIITGILVGVLAFLGDLSVSWYKRRLGIKDMGSIIPGHGGVLDRIDSHLLVFWGVYLLAKIQ